MRILLLALLTLVAGCGGCATGREGLHSTVLRLEFEGGVLCSGTARGPHELSTAKHCVVGRKLIRINGKPVKQIGWRATRPDAVIVSQSGMTFDAWPRVGKVKQGDRVFWWGSPLALKDMYREGYVAGFVGEDIVIDASTCTGDSGSGVFNERGELVAIVSRIASEHERCSSIMLAVRA